MQVLQQCSLFDRRDGVNLGPLLLSKSATFEVYEVAARRSADGLSFADPDTGASLAVVEPPIITAADVFTVQLTPGQSGDPHASLLIVLTGIGGSQLQQATAKASPSRLVIVADGTVLAVPQVLSPIGSRFRVMGERINLDMFARLTGK